MASYGTLEAKFWELQKELQKATQTPQNTLPKIQKVPEYLRNRNKFDKEYSPKSVSIGPIHHHNKNLKFGENYKLTCAAKYIKHIKHDAQSLHQKIADHIYEIKDLFTEDVLALANTEESLEGFRSFEEKLSWMMFVDGCFLLYILTIGQNMEDIVFYPITYPAMADVLLLENQLPFLVLKLLWENGNEDELIDTMIDFLWDDDNTMGRRADIEKKLPIEPPTHLLDLQRKLILITKSNPKTKKQSWKYQKPINRMPRWNIEDLTTSGVILKSSGTRSPKYVDFSEGWFSAELTLPKIVVNNATPSSFLNLIAYEMCPDFKNDYEISSFVTFIGSLIDHAEDVKKLRSQGILVNYLGSDEEVADLFNIISTEMVFNPDHYFEVKIKMYEHRFRKVKTWLAQCYHTYFDDPGTMIAFIATVIALVLTFLQTWFTISSP